MIGALSTLGFDVDGDADDLTVGGALAPAPRRAGAQRLGEWARPASTAAWLARGAAVRAALAALSTASVLFDGDEQACARPIAPLLDGLRVLGVQIEGGGLPFTVHGAGAVAGGPGASTPRPPQFVSGLLLCGAAFADG